METPSFAVAFLGGLLLFFSPCIAPVIPAYLSAISGVRWSQLQDPRGLRWRVMSNALAFVLGFSTLFILMGVLLGLLSGISGVRGWVNVIGGAVILILALHMLELIRIPLLDREFSVSDKVQPKGYLGSALLGGAFGLAWTPCTGPVLATILTLSASTETMGQSALLMAAFSAGLAIPFLLTGAFTSRISKWLSAHQAFMRWLHRATGVMLIVLGVLIFTGRLEGLLGWLLGVLNISI
ncbi:MAG TPA: cytochrome c biogenesis protein CcdA [Candidatus Bipolaricaulota bacterium]